MGSMSHSPTRLDYLDWRIWVSYGALFAIGIPWYWPADMRTTFMGFPLWAAVSVIASFLISAKTAWLLIKHWPADVDDESTRS